jgi:hypothetical protein
MRIFLNCIKREKFSLQFSLGFFRDKQLKNFAQHDEVKKYKELELKLTSNRGCEGVCGGIE